jgi:hypothetical protein
MSQRKYPVLNESCTDIDPQFKGRMLGACRAPYERGLVHILDLTGMHVSSIQDAKLVKQGSRWQLEWARTKTRAGQGRTVPKEAVDDVKAYLEKRPRSRQHLRRIVKQIGERAGYEGISPMTFRHNQCIKSLKRHHFNPITAAQDMGCDFLVVLRNYSKLSDEQLDSGGHDSETDDGGLNEG